MPFSGITNGSPSGRARMRLKPLLPEHGRIDLRVATRELNAHLAERGGHRVHRVVALERAQLVGIRRHGELDTIHGQDRAVRRTRQDSAA
jgi:hypothetical protein